MSKIDYSLKENKLRPATACRKQCLICMDNDFNLIRDCRNIDCIIYGFRMGKGKCPVELLKRYCTFCRGGRSHASECQNKRCPFFPYRPVTNKKGRTNEN